MRITVLVVFSEQQHSTLAHEVHDLRCEAAGVINRTIDFQAITFADHKVVVAMARSGVHTTGASFTGDLLISRLADVEFGFRVSFASQSYVVAHHQQRWTVQPGVATL